MENYDSLFQEQKSEQPFDKEAWVDQKRQERQRLFEIIDDMADKTFSEPKALTEYLDMQSKLRRTSVGNTLLVISQKPDATWMVDYDDWQKKGRSVKKGEKGVLILAPDGEYTRDDGTTGVRFKAKSVFDVAQTHGQALRKRTPVPIKTLLRALMKDTTVQIKLSDSVSQDIGALYSREDKAVHVARGLDGVNLFKHIACELAHAEMNGADPQMASFVSSCAANVVCKRFGIEADEYDSIPESISGMAVRDKRSILEKIRETACDMGERIDKNLYTEHQQHKQENRQR